MEPYVSDMSSKEYFLCHYMNFTVFLKYTILLIYMRSNQCFRQQFLAISLVVIVAATLAISLLTSGPI